MVAIAGCVALFVVFIAGIAESCQTNLHNFAMYCIIRVTNEGWIIWKWKSRSLISTSRM